MLGGRPKKIMLSPDWVEESVIEDGHYYGGFNTYALYRIPPEARDFRSISSVEHVEFPYSAYSGLAAPTITGYPNSQMSTLYGLANQALDSQTGRSKPVLPDPILRSGDIVLLTPFYHVPTMNLSWILKCRLHYDEEFTNINDQALQVLRKLVVMATKARIYLKLAIQMDLSELQGGQEIGRVREIIDSYSDQNEQYSEELKSFVKVAKVLDPESRSNIMYYML
jgi:hypothetical protein